MHSIEDLHSSEPEYGKDEVVYSYLDLLVIQSLINNHLFGNDSSTVVAD